MPWNLPEIKRCCGCVRDLKTATAIIAVLGIVTSPAVSWATVRHAYVIRVSCIVSTSELRPDVVDINLNNVFSFGFGANAGLGPTCLGKTNQTYSSSPQRSSSGFVSAVKYIGWIVLLADLVSLITSIYLLYKLYHGSDKRALTYFMWTTVTVIVLSFFYGMLYVTACISVGGAFPIFEFAFCIIDSLLWLYLLIVVQSYRRKSNLHPTTSGLP